MEDKLGLVAAACKQQVAKIRLYSVEPLNVMLLYSKSEVCVKVEDLIQSPIENWKSTSKITAVEPPVSPRKQFLACERHHCTGVPRPCSRL